MRLADLHPDEVRCSFVVNSCGATWHVFAPGVDSELYAIRSTREEAIDAARLGADDYREEMSERGGILAETEAGDDYEWVAVLSDTLTEGGSK